MVGNFSFFDFFYWTRISNPKSGDEAPKKGAAKSSEAPKAVEAPKEAEAPKVDDEPKSDDGPKLTKTQEFSFLDDEEDSGEDNYDPANCLHSGEF